MLNKYLRFIFVTKCLLFSSCVYTAGGETNAPSVAPEATACLTHAVYGEYVTITGSAGFLKRNLKVTTNGIEVTKLGLAEPIPAPLPIRYAEVQVLNNNGQIVQCGTTDDNGNIKSLNGTSDLRIPTTVGTYKINVLSRVNYTLPGRSNKVSISIKDNIYDNGLYSISASINSTGSSAYSVSLKAEASETKSTKIEGGAFNILNDIVTSFNYIADNTTENLSCLEPKLNVYWTAGFNPASYIPGNPSDNILSFYLRTDNEMYISGGSEGRVANIDTDHFDDAVIIHELGHHIENVCGRMDSPGGAHTGNSRIDPRLAWSEGWGNFFGAHIIRNNLNSINPYLVSPLSSYEGWKFYFDSDGYAETISGGPEMIRINLARIGKNSTAEYTSGRNGSGNLYFDQVNPTSFPGESHTREVSIARGLFKSTNQSCTNCVGTNNFSSYWKALNRTTGLAQNQYPYSSSVRFLERLKTALGGSLSSVNNIVTNDEALHPYNSSAFTSGGFTTWVPYAVNLVPVESPTTCNLKIKPRAYLSYSMPGRSDQYASNHFYHVRMTNLSGVTEINLNASYSGGTAGLDVDLLLFNSNYKFNEDGSSKSTTGTGLIASARGSGGGAYPKKIYTGNLDGNSYLLDVRVFTPSTVDPNTEYIYTLTDQNGRTLCPTTDNSF